MKKSYENFSRLRDYTIYVHIKWTATGNLSIITFVLNRLENY